MKEDNFFDLMLQYNDDLGAMNEEDYKEIVVWSLRRLSMATHRRFEQTGDQNDPCVVILFEIFDHYYCQAYLGGYVAEEGLENFFAYTREEK